MRAAASVLLASIFVVESLAVLYSARIRQTALYVELAMPQSTKEEEISLPYGILTSPSRR